MDIKEVLMSKFLSIREIAEVYRKALDEKKPISMVCVGDGEVYIIAHKKDPLYHDYPPELMMFYPYMEQYGPELLDGIFCSDIIGVMHVWPRISNFFTDYSIPMDRLYCDWFIGRGLHFTGLLYSKILKNKRVYLVGNAMGLVMLPILEKYQIELAGYTNVDNFPDIPRVKECLSKVDFDFALLSAGPMALILGPWITKTLRRCSLDFGSAVSFVSNNMDLIGEVRNDYNVFVPEAKNGFIELP